MRKRFFAWLIVLAMTLSLLPVGALAAEAPGNTAEKTTLANESAAGEAKQEDSDGIESSERNGGLALEPGPDGTYSISYDTELNAMVQMINQAESGSRLSFRFAHRWVNGTIYRYTSDYAMTVPAGVSVTIDLGMCDMLFDTEDPTVITNNGTLSVSGDACTSMNYNRIGAEAQTIVNQGTMTLDTVYIEGTLDNRGRLTMSQTAEGVGYSRTCTVGTLSNSGTVTADGCEFEEKIIGTAGKMTLKDCYGGLNAPMELTGSAQLELNGGLYATKSVSLSDSSRLVIENSEFSDLQNDGLTIADTAQLQISGSSGVFAFNPEKYLTGENLLVLRSPTISNYVNLYTFAPIDPGAAAPELTVEQGAWKDEDGNVPVWISTTTEDAQVFYSTDPEKKPVDCQTNIQAYRTANVPVGTTVYAVALKAGCPAAVKELTVTEPVTPGWAAPEILPSDSQVYQSSITVTITSKEPDAAIYYTTNGQVPGYSTAARPDANTGTASSVTAAGDGSAQLPIVGTRYSGPFTLSSSATVMAVAITPDGDQSEVASRQYRIVVDSNPGGGSSSGGSSSGGSSSGSRDDDDNDDRNTTTETTRNPDGSTTVTVTDNRTGTVTKTTRAQDGTKTVVETLRNGDTTTTITQRDGTVATTTVVANGPIRADVDFSSGAVADSEDGRLAAPVQVDAQSSVVVISGIRQPMEVAIPVDGLTIGTVAVIGGEIVKTALPENGSLVIPMEESGTVTIMDNTRNFTDVPAGHWAADAVTFVTSRTLFSGTGANTFTPDSAMTRQMLVTVLARLDGADIDAAPYELAMEWAQNNGISDGSNPTGSITREQLAVMLYRYAGSPAVESGLTQFADAERVSGYAQEAMAWAVANDIVAGTGDGNLTPQGLATRAQVAAMLRQYLSL